MSEQSKVFRTTKLKLSDLISDPEKQIPVLALFDDLDTAKVQATRTGRQYQSALAEVTLKQNKLLLEVGQHSKLIDQEPMVFAYKKGEDIIFEIPFTERDHRNAIRSQVAQMDQAARNLGEQGGGDLYEEQPPTE